MGEIGITNLKKVTGKVINFGMAVKDAVADHKVTLSEGVGLLTDIIGFGTILTSWKEVKDEYHDLDDSERQELHDYLAGQFDLENDKVEAIVEDGFEVLLVVDKFTLNFR